MRRTGYSLELKESIKKRFQSPNSPSITELAAETGISIATLYNWRRETGYTKSTIVSPHRRSADEKWRLITEAEGLDGEDLGIFLRREGIYLAYLDQWKTKALEALKPIYVYLLHVSVYKPSEELEPYTFCEVMFSMPYLYQHCFSKSCHQHLVFYCHDLSSHAELLLF